MTRKRLDPGQPERGSLFLTFFLLLLICIPSPGRAEVFYGIDLGGGGIYTVDTITGGPDTLAATFPPPASTTMVTLANRPSDGMLFFLDSMSANPNLWRWDPSNPSLAPVLLGTPGATTTNVIRLGFDGNNVLYASNGGAGGTLWVLDQNTGAIVSQVPLSGDPTVSGRGDLCLQPTTNTLYVVDSDTGTTPDTNSIYTITPAGVTTKRGNISGLPDGGITGCAFDSKNRLVVSLNSATAKLYEVNIGTLAATALPTAPGRSYGDLATAPGRKADLRLSQTASNPTPGNTVNFTITVTNDGPDITPDVRVADPLPAGLTLASYTASKGVLAYDTPLAKWLWRIGPLASGANATLTITANVTTTGAKTNTVEVYYSDMPDPDSTPNNNVATEDDQASVTVTPSPDLQVVKTATSPFAVGVDATYSLAVNNTLGSAATSGTYTVTDTLDANLSYISAAGTGWTCGFASPLLTCTNSAPMAAGGANANAITVTVRPLAGASPSVNNTAAITGGGEPGSNNTNNSSAITTAVCSTGTGCPDLQVGKIGPASFTVPNNGTYTLSAKNTTGGLATYAAYTITDPMPTGLTIVGTPSGTGWDCSASTATKVDCFSNTVIAAAGTNPNNITVTVTPTNNAVPNAVNIASISGGGEPTGATANNSTTVITPVNDFDLTVTKVKASPAGNFAVPYPAAPSPTGSYTITVNNIGNRATPTGAGHATTVTDTLPTGVTYSSASGTNWSCAAVGQVVTCTNSASAIAIGGSAPAITLNVAITANAAPTAVNNVTVSHPDEPPAYTGNNSATLSTPVDAPDLLITKTHNGNFIVGASAQEYYLTVHNIGAQVTSTDPITVIDTLPAGLTYVSGTGTYWTCGAVGQVVTCTRPANRTINANSSGQPITLTVNVTNPAAAASPVTNSVTVSGGNEPAGNNTNNSDSDLTYVYVAPQIGKAFSPTSVPAGTKSTLTITITNPSNPVAMTGLAFIDPLPAGMAVASIPNLTNTCGGSFASGQNQGDTVIDFSGGGPLAIGSCTITVDVVSSTTGTRTNTTGQISSSNSGTGSTATADLTVTVPTDPVLNMTSSPDPVGINMPVTLTYTINNDNVTRNTAALSLGFTHNFPVVGGAQMVYQSLVSNGCTASSTLANPAGGGLVAGTSTGIKLSNYRPAANANCAIVITATVGAAGTVTTGLGTPGISGLLPAGAGGLQSNVNDTFNVRGATLTKDFSPNPTTENSVSTLTFTITNGTGNPSQNGLAFTDTLPVLPAVGFTVASAPVATQCNGTVTAAVGGNTITLAGGNLALGQATCTVVVEVKATTAGSYVNNAARISGLSANLTNSVDATLVVNPVAKATISKGFSPATIDVYEPSTMTFTLGNSNSSALSNARFTDLWSGFYVRNASIGGTCVGTSNSPALVGGETALDLTVPSLPAGGCTITIPVTASVSGGPYNNTTSGVTTTETGGTAGAGSNTATLTIKLLPIQLTKVSSSGSSASPGATINYTIGYTNPNATTPFKNVVITDTIPPFTTFISASCETPLPATLTACNISAPAVGATGTVTWTMVGDLNPGPSKNVYLSVQVE